MLEKELLLDIHTHTIASGHAYGTIRENAQAAAERGLKLYGHSEHGPGMTGTCEPIYYDCFPRIPRMLYGVEILGGCELNIQDDGTFLFPEEKMRCLDYAIIGIHSHGFTNEGKEKNTAKVISCMKHEKVFFAAHPDDDHTPLDYPTLVRAAKEYNVALEVNNSSFRKLNSRLNCIENYRTMLGLCREEHVPIIINTDAHDPSEVGVFYHAAKFVEEFGFPKELILNTDVERFKEFIHYRFEKEL